MPERDRLIAKQRRHRPAPRHLFHLEQALDLQIFFKFFLNFFGRPFQKKN